MKKSFFTISALLFASFLFAEEELPESFDREAAQECVLDKRQNYFLTSTDYRIAPKVNPITGEYCEEEADLVVAGSEPLSVRRFYNSSGPYDPRFASWRYNPECFFVANLEWQHQEIFASVGDNDGSVSAFKRSSQDYYLFDFEVPKSFLAFQPDGAAHPLNTKIRYRRHGDPKDKHRYEYRGSITDGSGRTRTFASAMHRWTHFVHWKEKKGSWLTGGSEKLWRIHANTWTPYHIPITEERLPNGNILCYTYTQWKKEKQNYPLPKLLSSITAYNADKSKVLGSIRLHYSRAKHDEVAGIQITGSDGRSAHIQHAGKSPINLASAQTPGSPPTKYAYLNRSLNSLTKPEGRILKTEYNKEGKVAAQYAPVGPNGEMHPIGRYVYGSHMTQVLDAEGNRVDYHFDDHKRLLSINTLKNNRTYRQERFERDAYGNITRKTISDANNTPFLITEYKYDKNHNPVEEKMGDGKERRTITRTFSDDGFNLKLTESDREGKLIRYAYVPNTNLLASEITFEGNAIRKRIFHTYDQCAICIRTIIDDGSTADPDDLKGITYRKITTIIPKDSTPCFGLPESVEEKTIDPSGSEILLSKTVYTYTPFGKILQEDHYDANGIYRYSLYNTYDDQECLVSTTDPLGAVTAFTYDANHNLISISGPRSDQHQEIAYDKANRPIRIADWQTDGSILITEKKYNKLGQVIEETNPCGQTTLFTYDALGRVIAVQYPEGAVMRTEYDILGNITKETDPEGYVTKKTHNAFGQPLSVHYPDGSEEAYTYNHTGTIHTYTDKNGAATRYTYDIFDHPIRTEIYSPSGKLLKTTTSTWSPFCKLSDTEDDLTTTFTYDFAGRKIAEQTGYKIAEYAYDSLGRLHSTQNEETRTVEEHDLAGRLVQTRTEKGTTIQKQEGYAYDEAGNRIQVITSQGVTETTFNTNSQPLSLTDPLGFSTHYAYEYGIQLSKTTTNPNGIQTLTTYDSRGRETLRNKKNTKGETIQKSESLYDKNGSQIQLAQTIFSGTEPINTILHSWEYGPLGRLERFIEAGEKETRYLYDSKGRLQTIIKPDGCRLNHEYDELGRLSRYYADDFDYRYTYDQRDRVTCVHDALSHSTTTRTYDPLSNILQETLANGLAFTSIYDTRGRKIRNILPDASSIEYDYDGVYLDTVSRNAYVHTYAVRNLEGQIVEARTPIGKISIARDPIGRYKKLDAPYFSATGYTYDPAGNLTRYAYEDPLGKMECAYSYDDLDQLIQENGHAYCFDSLHNRLKKDSDDYTVNPLCQVTHDGRIAYIYDPCGNLISDGTRTYFYDSLDRLIAVEEGNKRVEYTYDPFHRRLSKTTFANHSQIGHIRYLWDGDHEIGAINEKGKIQELRILGERLGAEIGAAVLYELNGKTLIPIHDQRGCVVALLDARTQAPLEYYRYTAFGEEQTGHRLSPWRFSSKRIDEETGFAFFGRRYYNPNLGRWITQDPQGFDDGPNLYAYLSNAPLLDVDPYGLFSRDPWIDTALNCCGLPGAAMKFFGFGKSQTYTNFEDPFFNKSYNSSLGLRELSIGEIGRTNGILNKRSDVRQAAMDLSRVIGGYNIHYTHNETHGLYDFHEAGMNLYRGVVTEPSVKIQERWDAFFERSPPGVPYYEECHSQGTALVRNALVGYPKELRDRIIVRAFAPSAYISRDLCGDVKHFVSDHDWVHRFDFKGKRQYADTVIVLPRHPKGSRFLDHSISSPTFSIQRQEEIRTYIKNLSKYENN